MDKLLKVEDWIISELEDLHQYLEKIPQKPLYESIEMIEKASDEVEAILEVVVKGFAELKHD